MVGNGSGENPEQRSNALTVSKNGNTYISGDLRVGGNNYDDVTYQVGDTGPAGGVIFYIDDNTYYEARTSDQSFSGGTAWGCSYEVPGSDGTAIGTGEQNTADLSPYFCTAAKRAEDHSKNGYEDWYLPSRGELNRCALTAV